MTIAYTTNHEFILHFVIYYYYTIYNYNIIAVSVA